MKRRLLLGSLFLAAAPVCWAVIELTSRGTEERPPSEPAIVMRRLISVEAGQPTNPVELSVGDVVQLAPYAYPFAPKYAGAKLEVDSSGDRVLQEVGQVDLPLSVGEGGTSRAAFLLARRAGTAKITLVLKAGGGNRLIETAVVYRIVVKDPPASAKH